MDVFKKLTIFIKSNLVKFFNVCLCGYLSGFIKMSNQILFNFKILQFPSNFNQNQSSAPVTKLLILEQISKFVNRIQNDSG